MIVLFIGGQVIGNDKIDLLMPMLNVHESSSLQKDCRDYYALTIKRLALIVFHSLSNFNLHLLSIMVQQCTYKNKLHHDGYDQIKDYNECIHNLSLQNQVDIFQYTNILHHKNIAKFHKKF